MRVENQITKCEQELKALKSSFQQSAAQMPMFSAQLTFSTSQNAISFTHGAIDPTEWSLLLGMPQTDNNTYCGLESVVVTFNCDGGSNTFANLEIDLIDATNTLFGIETYRTPYNGGARWLVVLQPNVTQRPDFYYDWKPNVLSFVVKSAVAGTLGAKMIWE